jgi:hypothetical protein
MVGGDAALFQQVAGIIDFVGRSFAGFGQTRAFASISFYLGRKAHLRENVR